MWPAQGEDTTKSSAQKPAKSALIANSFSAFDLRDEPNESYYEEEDALRHPVITSRKPARRRDIQGPSQKNKVRRQQTLPLQSRSEVDSYTVKGRRESQSTVLRRYETEYNLKDRRQKAEQLKKQKREAQLQKEREEKQQKKQLAKKRRERIQKTDEKIRKKTKKQRNVVPTTINDVAMGDVVLAAKGIAIARWKGELHFRPNDGMWLGIEFVDGPYGKNDGMVKGQRYFQTKKPMHGSFVKKVNKILSSEALLYKLGNVKSDLNKQLNETRNQLNEVLSKQQEQIELLKLNSGGAMNKSGSQLSVAKHTLALVSSLSGNLDKFTDDNFDSSEEELQFGYDDDSSDEEYQRNQSKASRKNLLQVSTTEAYSDGSLQQMEQDMLEQMKKLESFNPKQKKSVKITRNKTFANLGMELPQARANKEEIQSWIISNMARAPGCPDLGNPEILSALGWAEEVISHHVPNLSITSCHILCAKT